jgi:hypothetical protein
MSVRSLSSSESSSSSEAALPPLPMSSLTAVESRIYRKLDCMRLTSSAFMIAVLVGIVVVGVLIGLAQARYLLPTASLYAMGGCVVPFVISLIIDCRLRAYAEANNVDPRIYFERRQPSLKQSKGGKSETKKGDKKT